MSGLGGLEYRLLLLLALLICRSLSVHLCCALVSPSLFVRYWLWKNVQYFYPRA